MPECVCARAPGKINIFLAVGKVDKTGYHEIVTVFQAVTLSEEVQVVPANNFSVRVTGGVELSRVPTDERNIALMAARALAGEIGYPGGVEIVLRKNVPVTGGMGGGSADAAATLLACNTLWDGGLSLGELQHLGAKLGADVPFALLGGTALGTGRGDKLTSLRSGTFHWVLVFARYGLSTPEVYRQMDQEASNISPPVLDPRVLAALETGDAYALAPLLRNDLQNSSLRLAPELDRVLKLAKREGALGGIVSGSGPTIALLTAGDTAARKLARRLGDAGFLCSRATGPAGGAQLLSRAGRA